MEKIDKDNRISNAIAILDEKRKKSQGKKD